MGLVGATSSRSRLRQQGDLKGNRELPRDELDAFPRRSRLLRAKVGQCRQGCGIVGAKVGGHGSLFQLATDKVAVFCRHSVVDRRKAGRAVGRRGVMGMMRVVALPASSDNRSRTNMAVGYATGGAGTTPR